MITETLYSYVLRRSVDHLQFLLKPDDNKMYLYTYIINLNAFSYQENVVKRDNLFSKNLHISFHL